MATPADFQRLRNDIGASEDALGNPEAMDIYDEAAESYTDAASIKAATRVIAIQRLLASSAKLTTYTQNNSREEVGKVFDNLSKLLTLWQGRLYAAIALDVLANRGSVARFGKTTRRPARIKEYPGI